MNFQIVIDRIIENKFKYIHFSQWWPEKPGEHWHLEASPSVQVPGKHLVLSDRQEHASVTQYFIILSDELKLVLQPFKVEYCYLQTHKNSHE
jgi:hypothetical protein